MRTGQPSVSFAAPWTNYSDMKDNTPVSTISHGLWENWQKRLQSDALLSLGPGVSCGTFNLLFFPLLGWQYKRRPFSSIAADNQWLLILACGQLQWDVPFVRVCDPTNCMCIAPCCLSQYLRASSRWCIQVAISAFLCAGFICTSLVLVCCYCVICSIFCMGDLPCIPYTG